MQGSRFKGQCSMFKVQGSSFKVQVSRFNVQCSRFAVQGSRFMVQCSDPHVVVVCAVPLIFYRSGVFSMYFVFLWTLLCRISGSGYSVRDP